MPRQIVATAHVWRGAISASTLPTAATRSTTRRGWCVQFWNRLRRPAALAGPTRNAAGTAMRSREAALVSTVVVVAVLSFSGRAVADTPAEHPGQQRHQSLSGFVSFDAPGAGTGLSQGTFPNGVTQTGAVTGWYVDPSNVNHGFLRTPEGTITTFDVPGAGNGPFQGTIAFGMNSAGAIAGLYFDASNMFHGYVRTPDGAMTTFDSPSAGTGASQGSAAGNIDYAGQIYGDLIDANGVHQVFLRAPDGTITALDVPGAI